MVSYWLEGGKAPHNCCHAELGLRSNAHLIPTLDDGSLSRTDAGEHKDSRRIQITEVAIEKCLSVKNRHTHNPDEQRQD